MNWGITSAYLSNKIEVWCFCIKLSTVNVSWRVLGSIPQSKLQRRLWNILAIWIWSVHPMSRGKSVMKRLHTRSWWDVFLSEHAYSPGRYVLSEFLEPFYGETFADAQGCCRAHIQVLIGYNATCNFSKKCEQKQKNNCSRRIWSYPLLVIVTGQGILNRGSLHVPKLSLTMIYLWVSD